MSTTKAKRSSPAALERRPSSTSSASTSTACGPPCSTTRPLADDMPIRFTRRIRRTRQGEFEVRLPPEEREVLRSLPGQMRDALELGNNDPAVARLNPSACLDDSEVDAEYRQ